MSEPALLVLECPWWTPKEDPRRSSVLPFFEGLGRCLSSFNIYYSTFYDEKGFTIALRNDLTITNESRQILWIGAHGARTSLADGNAHKTLCAIPKFGKNIEGIILSSCCVGNNTKALKSALHYSSQSETYGGNWIFAYQDTVNWTSSVIVELCILQQVFEYDSLKSRDKILEAFGVALKKFNPDWVIAENENNIPVSIKDTIRLVFRGKGATKSKDLTDDLLHYLKWK